MSFFNRFFHRDEQKEVVPPAEQPEVLPIDREIDALYQALIDLIGTDSLVIQAGRMNAMNLLRSSGRCERVLALQRILDEDPLLHPAPREEDLPEVLQRLTERIAEKRARKDIEDRIEKQNREARTLHQSLVCKAKEELEATEERHTAAKTMLGLHERRLKDLEQQLEDFRRRWKEVERLSFSWNAEEAVCPTCGQPLPQDQADQKRVEAEMRFNERKMQQQDALDEEGKKLAASKQRLQDLSAAAREEMATAERLRPEARERLSKAEAEPIEQADYHDAADWQRLSGEIDQRMKELEQTTQAQEPPQLAALRTEEQAYR